MATKKKTGPTYRTLDNRHLDSDVFLSLSVLAKHAYTHMVLVMGGPSGIGNFVLERWYARTGFTAETAREPLEELRQKGLVAIEGAIVWVVDYFQRGSATHSCQNPAHRKQAYSYVCDHLPRRRIVNDFALYYGFEQPYPELGVSGEWGICPEAKRFLAKQHGHDENGWPTRTPAPGVGPHHVAEQVQEILYVRGEAPEGDSDNVARGIVKRLLDTRATADEIVAAAQGLVLMREDGRLRHNPAGKSLSVKVLAEEYEGWTMDNVARMYLDKHANGERGAALDRFIDALGSTRFRKLEREF